MHTHQTMEDVFDLLHLLWYSFMAMAKVLIVAIIGGALIRYEIISPSVKKDLSVVRLLFFFFFLARMWLSNIHTISYIYIYILCVCVTADQEQIKSLRSCVFICFLHASYLVA